MTQIYTQATPDAEVRHNFKILGRSGRKRQIDISIAAKQGLHSYLTVIECKRYARPVGITTVEAFATKLKDVRANKGVMVSTKGFDEGARAQANQHDITLFSYREAVETDWEKVSAASLWVTFTTEQFVPKYMLAELLDGSVVQVDPREMLCTADDEACFTGLEMAGSMIEHHPFMGFDDDTRVRRGPGAMWIKGRINTTLGPLFIRREDQPYQVDQLTIQGDNQILAYSVNPLFDSGHVMEDALTGLQPYTEVSSVPFNLHAVVHSQEGRVLTEEEYRSTQSTRFFIPPEATAENAQFRITITAPTGEA